MIRFTNALVAFGLAATVCAPAQATRYTGTFSGVTPVGWIDTTGVFGAQNAVYSALNFSANFTYDISEWSGGGGNTSVYFDNSGAATPSYSMIFTLGSVTVPYFGNSGYFGIYRFSGLLSIYFGDYDEKSFLEVQMTDATAAAAGIDSQAFLAGRLPSFALTASQIHFGEVLFDRFAGGGLSLPVTAFSVTAVPEPASWAMMLIGFGAMGVALRRRRAVALQTA